MGDAKGNGFACGTDMVIKIVWALLHFSVCVVAELHEGIVHTIRPVAGLRVPRERRKSSRLV
jgi:hypothetical protein